jgi:transcriptional regulator with XRE-family HTH domain
MIASEAVASLRKKLELSREQFAQRVGVSAKMIQRIEAGQQPSTRVLAKLAAIAKDAELKPFEDLFDATRRANMGARVDDVRKTGRARRVALSDLKYWSAYLHKHASTIQGISPETEREHLVEHLRVAASTMDHIASEIDIPIAEPYTFTRMQEDEQILKNHKTKQTYGLEGVKHGKPKTRK